MNKKFDLILFDLDGTLFDTAKTLLDSIKGAVKLAGLRELTEDELNTFIGPPVVFSLKGYYPHLSNDEIDNLTTMYRDYYMKNEMLKANLFPGMLDVLKGLKENGYKVALATYKLMKCVIPLFENKDVAKYFDSINKEILLNILKRKIKDMDLIWLINEILYSQKRPIGIEIRKFHITDVSEIFTFMKLIVI